ncbi:mCpol domain-containing protein [Neobacillus niacini]|uniref:mCpol domain-containing protein n=1 Tax=Neobacillus niacini TaxID=86668 RepID=UPI0007ABEE20|nr:mCpol domain-containing protein [Neobacillus niacini]MEC1524445.1 mCpol domain-containing protein [Neobacillus niacini]
MMYAYIDGDDIGLKIENSFMENDEVRLKHVNELVKETVNKITYELESNNYIIIFGGADGIICKKEKIEVQELLFYLRGITKELTFSIGVGMCLRDAFLALRYAKSSGKDIGAIYQEEFTLFK